MNAVYNLGPRLQQAKRWGKEKLAGGSLDNRQLNDYVEAGPLTAFFQPPDTVWTPACAKRRIRFCRRLGCPQSRLPEYRPVQRRMAAAFQAVDRRSTDHPNQNQRCAEEFQLLGSDRSADTRHGLVLLEDHSATQTQRRARRRQLSHHQLLLSCCEARKSLPNGVPAAIPASFRPPCKGWILTAARDQAIWIAGTSIGAGQRPKTSSAR